MSLIITNFPFDDIHWSLRNGKEGRTVVRIVLLARVFSTVNRVNFPGDFDDDVKVDCGSARNGRDGLLCIGGLHFVEEVRREDFVGRICSTSLSLQIRRETAQRWIFRWKFALINDDRILSAEDARFVME